MSDNSISDALSHLFTLLPLVLSIAILVFDLYNPTPFVPWCSVSMYPWLCTGPGGKDENNNAQNCKLWGNENGQLNLWLIWRTWHQRALSICTYLVQNS